MWEGQKEGVRGGIGEKPKMRVFFFQKFLLFSEIQTLSQKLLVRQTSNYHRCDGMPKDLYSRLSSDFKQFFLVKNSLLISVHNDTDDTDDYNRVIGIALLKAFSCAKKGIAVIFR